MAKVVCDQIKRCVEQCGGRKPHWPDDNECGHCPRSKVAKCVEVNVKDWDKLTVEEQEHLTSDAGVITTDDLVKNFEGQKHLRTLGKTEPCWTCKNIARKLGYEV